MYVKDTAKASWTSGDTYLWHKVDALSSNLPEPLWAKAACGHKINNPAEIIDHDMTLTEWDREYGEDVDLCECAVRGKDKESLEEELLRREGREDGGPR